MFATPQSAAGGSPGLFGVQPVQLAQHMAPLAMPSKLLVCSPSFYMSVADEPCLPPKQPHQLCTCQAEVCAVP